MLFIFYVILLCVLLLRYSNSSRYFMKPSFSNYCDLQDKCKPACNCEVYPNCSLLAMDETVRKTILFYHNQIRDIQSAGEPQPSGMTMLQYDMQLEEISKCWAARCDNEYSVCFKTPKFQETSQSVGGLILEGEESPNVFLWLQMMSYWLGQADVVSAKAIQSFPTGRKHESMHNFAQLMSDKVMSVGCAWSILTTDNWLIFVCTYGPRGPQQGESIYRTGISCSQCPEDYACDYVKPFERLCKPNPEDPRPPESFPSVENKQEEDQRVSPEEQSFGQQNTPSHTNFNDPASASIYQMVTPEQYTAAPYPQIPQGYSLQEYPQPPAMPPEPIQPTFHQDEPPYHPQLSSPMPQQFSQYIPQPPRLPPPFNQPPNEPFVPYPPQVPPPSPSNDFQPPPPIPPAPQEGNIQDYYQPEPPPILPPPPTEETFEVPQFNQAVLPYPAPSEYFPGPVRPNISPQVPQPPPLDLPPPPPVFESDFKNHSPNVPTLPPPIYDTQRVRSFYSGLKPNFRYLEVAMQTSSSVPLPRPQQFPPQHTRAIVLPHAEPLPPPLSYFPPQPPPLPREQSEYFRRNYVMSPMPPLPSGPPIQPPPRQISSWSQQKPPYETPSNPIDVSDKPILFAPSISPGQSRPNSVGGRRKDRKIEDNLRPERSNEPIQESSLAVIIYSNIFVLAIM